jgi:hypothetical protein
MHNFGSKNKFSNPSYSPALKVYRIKFRTQQIHPFNKTLVPTLKKIIIYNCPRTLINPDSQFSNANKGKINQSTFFQVRVGSG